MTEITLLPPNASKQERALDLATSRLGDVPVPIRTLYDAATCPAPLLPWLAWAYSVDQWDTTWSEAQKRAAVAASLAIHKHKGTVAAVKAAMAAAGAPATMVEWWQMTPKGTPYTFEIDVDVSDVGLDDVVLDRLAALVDAAKNERSHYTMRVNARTTGMQYWAIVTVSGETTTVLPYTLTELDAIDGVPRVGFGFQSWDTIFVFPQAHA